MIIKKRKKEKFEKEVIIAAIICLTLVEIAALFNNVNGTLMLIIVAAISGLAGWVIPFPNALKGGR